MHPGMSRSDDVARETSSATTRLVLAYVRERAGDDAVARVLEVADVPHTLAELEDPSRWVSYDVRIRLFAAVVEVLGDPRAMFSVGATLVTSTIAPSLLLLVRALGSAAQVYRQLPRAVSKFSTTSTMSVLEATSTSASIRFELHEGYVPSRLDCDYARGLISTVPEVFGLPRANVVHEECQAEGAPACVYHVTWSRRHRWARGRRADDCELAALRQQLSDLQSASADLVASDDVGEVLQRITERAAASVLAQGYLLAVHPADDGPPIVQSTGIPADQVDVLARRLLAGDDLGRGAVVVDIVSARRKHGRLAALSIDGQRGLHDERRLLAAFASHAAAALDLLTALEDSRRDGARSAALLSLAHRLAGVTDAGEVAQVVTEMLPSIVGCTQAAVMLWEPVAGELRTAATVGLPPEREQVMRAAVLRALDVPELAELVTDRLPTTVTLGRRVAGARRPARGARRRARHRRAAAVGRRAARRGDRQLGLRPRTRRRRRRAGPAAERRGRPGGDGPAGRPAGEPGAPPGAARRAHRPAQPGAVRRPARAGARRRRRHGGAVLRPRPLQAGQRPARARGGRRAAAPGGAPPRRRRARRRGPRPAQRRRVRGAARR